MPNPMTGLTLPLLSLGIALVLLLQIIAPPVSTDVWARATGQSACCAIRCAAINGFITSTPSFIGYG